MCSPAKVVGWPMADTMTTDLVLSAFEMGLWRRDVMRDGLIHHSERLPIHLAAVHPTPRRRRRGTLHRIGRRQLRQRHGRIVLRQPENRADLPAPGPAGTMPSWRSSLRSKAGTTRHASSPDWTCAAQTNTKQRSTLTPPMRTLAPSSKLETANRASNEPGDLHPAGCRAWMRGCCWWAVIGW